MYKPELLAPAGSMESFKAAIEAGADAIYIGGKMFGARSFAPNFSNDEIKEAVYYAHLYGVKVYVTVNTLIYDNEVDELLDYVKYLHRVGVDAVIMQDIGMIDLVRKTLPDLDIHASTQAHIHNLDGTLLMEKLGLKRTVLARETSIDQIKYIKENSKIELEIFVHGALCISYSGQCLMSSLIGGRSGNRGECAGSCRLPYDLVDANNKKLNKDKYLLSTKDLNSLDNIGKLIDIGVDSFKIEGRMKRPIYVYMVVSLYRKAIDSYLKYHEVRITQQDIYDLKKIFNRGFTKGFLFGTDNNTFTNPFRPNHIGVKIGRVINYKNGYATVKLTDDLCVGDGIRILGDTDTGMTVTTLFNNHNKVSSATKGEVVTFKIDDVKVDSDVLKTTDKKQVQELETCINAKNRKVDIEGTITLKVGEMLKLELTDKVNIVNVSYGKVEKALKAPMSDEDITSHLSKLGDTPYRINSIKIIKDDNIFVNLKDLNEIRRQGISALNEKRTFIKPYKEGKYEIDVPDFDTTQNVNIEVPNIDIYNLIKKDNYNYIYMDDISNINDSRVIYKTPRVVDSYEDIKGNIEVSELGGLTQYSNYMTGVFLNVTNSYSVAFLHAMGSSKVTLSYELSYRQVDDIIRSYVSRYHKHPNTEVIIYSRIEAMISKYNLLCQYNIDKAYLKDRFGNKYPVTTKNDKMVIYNYEPTIKKDNYYDIGVNNIRVNILDKNEIKTIKLIIKK